MLLVLIGLASGIISGMGIGGGAILIPALVFVFMIDQHSAQGVNLIFFIPTAIIALVIHIKNKKVVFKTAGFIIAGGLAGAYLGSRLAVSLESAVLRKWFGVFLLFMGIYEMLRRGKDKHSNRRTA